MRCIVYTTCIVPRYILFSHTRPTKRNAHLLCLTLPYSKIEKGDADAINNRNNLSYNQGTKD